MILVYPLGLWLRSAGVGGAANPTLSAADALLQLSVDHYQAGRYEEALEAARSALAENPELAEAYNNIAVSFLQLHRYPEGIAAAEEALRLQPTFELARNNLALLRQQQAAATGEQTEPMMKEGLDLLYRSGDPAEAVTRFRQVLELNPDHYGANYQLAAALEQAGQAEEARAQWLKALGMARAIGDAETEKLINQHLIPAPSEQQKEN